MKPVNKNELLEKLSGKVESHLQIAVRTFQNLSPAQLSKPASNGGWSIAQCLEHLNRYGNYYLPFIEKGLENKSTTADFQFTSGWLGDYFIRTMDPSTGAKKYKAFKDYIPPSELNSSAVVATFIQQQENMLSYLRRARQANLNTRSVPVSINRLIKLKLGDVFHFLIAHIDRHVEQAKRNL